MKFNLATPIMGFENAHSAELVKIDEHFAQLKLENNASFSLINPFALREYAINLPIYSQALLDLDSNSQLEIYCMLVLQNPLEDTKVNFLSPLIFNISNKKALQVHFDPLSYPHLVELKPLKCFAK